MSPSNPEPRWLDDEEMRVWAAVVCLFVRLPSALDAQLRRDAGISHFEYQVLAGLSMSPSGAVRMSDLAAVTDSSLSRLSHTAARLETRGWLTRRPDPGDGRVTVATLTAAGRAKVAATAPGHVDTVRQYVFEPLTERQRTQLREIATLIVTAIGPTSPDIGMLPSRP